MSKFLYYIILSLYIFSCTDIQTNHIGEKGYECFDNGKCEKNLKCITGNICADPCENISCSGFGKCIIKNLNPKCKCDDFYVADGLNCIPDENNPCNEYSCKENSTCKVQNKEATCLCDSGYINEDSICVLAQSDPCNGVSCLSHATCDSLDGVCKCDKNYHYNNGICILNTEDKCNGCSGHGTCYIKEKDDPVCACDIGYTSGDQDGLTCVLTNTICKGAAIDYDYNNDGINEKWFKPTQEECEMYEMLNYIRAVHNKEGDSLESHKPLLYDAKWSAHARNHNLNMLRENEIFYDDYSGGQNAYFEENTLTAFSYYMGCSNPKEPICKSEEVNRTHCEIAFSSFSTSFHCNIMHKSWNYVGIGINDGYNTQNF